MADPDAIKIETDRDAHFLNFNLSVAPDDVGRVIGKHGRVAQAIRTIVYSVRVGDSLRVRLNIVDDYIGTFGETVMISSEVFLLRYF